jgi:succinate-semialdehyde dehydrogenase
MPFRSINPATGVTIAEYPTLSDGDVDAALDRAWTGWQHWAATPIEARAAALARLAGALRDRGEAIAQGITAEMGKPIREARAEVEKCAGTCDWFARHGPAALADERLPVEDDGAATLVWQPLGPIFAVMPWNFPVWQVIRAAVPIWLAGNGFVLKHADNVQGCAAALVAAVAEAGWPDGVLTNLAVEQDTIARILGDRRIRGATVTAGVAAGAAVAAEAGRHIKKTVLELGGIDPFVVLADADIDRAAEAAVRSRFANAGQVCIAAKRLIVEAPVLDRFTERVVALVEALTVGDPASEATDMGPLARPRGREAIDDQVRRSVASGARLLTGGAAIDGPGWFYQPTVLVDVAHGNVATCEELFGPIAAILPAADADEAIRLANASDYGLSAALWTGDPDRGQALARRIEAGAVFVNGISASDPRVPIGGIGLSGYGRELSHLAPREFCNAKLVWAR